jgi:site-specific DNA recombinase
MARLLGYRRVSHVGGRKELHSPAEQSEEIELWAKPRGHQVDLLEPELDGKGSDPNRPILREAIEAIKAGEYAGIVVAYLSRAGRGLRLMLDLWDEVEAAEVGGVVYFARENIDGSTTSGKLQRNLLASIAQHELEERRDGFERACKGAVEAGIWQRRQTPRGYDRDPDTRRLVPNEQAGDVVAAASDFLDGVPLTRLGERLGMSPGGVRAMLRNRVYLGELKVRSYVNKEAHEPILEPGTFEAVQAKLSAASRPARSAGEPMLLAGLARCTTCGHVMTRARSHADLIYRCPTHHSETRCPRPASIACQRLDPYVEEVAIQELGRLTIRASMASGVEDAQQEVTAAEAELSAYLQAVDMAGISAPDAAAGMRSRRERVDAARERLQRELSRTPSLPAIEGGAEVWPTLNQHQRNELLRGLLSAVAVRPVGAGARVPVADRVRIFAFGADVRLPGGRTGAPSGIVPLSWPDIDGVEVLGISSGKDAL